GGGERRGGGGQDQAHEQAPVAAALDAQALAGGDAPGHQVLGDGGEVLVHPVPVFLDRRKVPLRPVLTAAAEVGHHVGPAAGKPATPDDPAVRRGERDLE